MYSPLVRRPSTMEEILTIEIKPGWKKGTKITFPEKGNEQRGVIPSDLVFIIDEKPHNVFKRDGNDLVATQKISLVEALTGYTAQVTTLDGRNLTIPVNSIVSPTYEEVVKGEGMPIPKEPGRKGNLRIKFNIKFPSRLTPEQKTGIKRLLTSSWMLPRWTLVSLPFFPFSVSSDHALEIWRMRKRMSSFGNSCSDYPNFFRCLFINISSFLQ